MLRVCVHCYLFWWRNDVGNRPLLVVWLLFLLSELLYPRPMVSVAATYTSFGHFGETKLISGLWDEKRSESKARLPPPTTLVSGLATSHLWPLFECLMVAKYGFVWFESRNTPIRLSYTSGFLTRDETWSYWHGLLEWKRKGSTGGTGNWMMTPSCHIIAGIGHYTADQQMENIC